MMQEDSVQRILQCKNLLHTNLEEFFVLNSIVNIKCLFINFPWNKFSFDEFVRISIFKYIYIFIL